MFRTVSFMTKFEKKQEHKTTYSNSYHFILILSISLPIAERK